ncbi:hypothetical protein V2J09_002396 [Rumex salicifolius]
MMDSECLINETRTTDKINEASVVFKPWHNLVVSDHQFEVMKPFACETTMATRRNNCKKGDFVWPETI